MVGIALCFLVADQIVGSYPAIAGYSTPQFPLHPWEDHCYGARRTT